MESYKNAFLCDENTHLSSYTVIKPPWRIIVDETIANP